MPHPAEIVASLAEFPTDKYTVAKLFSAYAESLGLDLSFQKFDHELASLPGMYAPENGGAVYLAFTMECAESDGPATTTTTTTTTPTSNSSNVPISSSTGAASLAPAPTSSRPSSAVSTPGLDLKSEILSCKMEPVGCAGLRRWDASGVCELKRLYIAPEARGRGAARKLLELVLEKARELGYREMLLDTLRTMVAARRLYEDYGFVETEKYYDNPIEDVVFMKLVL